MTVVCGSMWKLILVLLVSFLSCQGQFEDDQFDLDEGWFTDDMYNDPYFVSLRNQGYGLIFPGTKWCGEGSSAKSFDDLGKYKETDACCRAHDNCPDIMQPGETCHNLTNPSSSTSLSCKCDRDLYGCLKAIRDVPSKTVGTLYFDILKKKCYEMANGVYVWRDAQSFSKGKFATFLRKIL